MNSIIYRIEIKYFSYKAAIIPCKEFGPGFLPEITTEYFDLNPNSFKLGNFSFNTYDILEILPVVPTPVIK